MSMLNLTILGVIVSSFLVPFINGENINYNDRIFIQINNRGRRWLTGGRSGGNEKVYSYDHLGTDYELNKRSAYQWIVRSIPGDGTRSSTDPNAASCLKFGDKVYFQVNAMDNRFLTGCRGKGNEGVRTRVRSQANRLIVRSNPGSGIRNDQGSQDPAFSTCVADKSVVFLQADSMDYRWLTGGRRSGNNVVLTRNFTGEKNVRSAYQFILRLHNPGNGGRSDAIQCGPCCGRGPCDR